MHRSLAKIAGLRGSLASACRPASACRHFSVKEAGRTSGRSDDGGKDANVVGSTVDELASNMGTGAKMPYGAGGQAGDAGPWVRIEGEAGVARKVESVQREAPAARMDDEVAGGPERLRGTPREDAGDVVPEGTGGKGSVEGGSKPCRSHGTGPRGWGAEESDSEAPPKGVVLE